MAQPRAASPATGAAGEGAGHESVPCTAPLHPLPQTRTHRVQALPCIASRMPLNSMVALRGGGPESGVSCQPLGRAAPSGRERGRRGRLGPGREKSRGQACA